MKVWREKDEKEVRHEGEGEGADIHDRTQKHSVTLSRPHKYTHMPVFWQAPKGPAGSIHTPSHLILFMVSPTLNTFPPFSSA